MNDKQKVFQNLNKFMCVCGVRTYVHTWLASTVQCSVHTYVTANENSYKI